MRDNIFVSELNQTYIEDLEIEIVERKGIGHPDSISDGIAQSVSNALCKMYEEKLGEGNILHHNTDEVQITAGDSDPKFGGGAMLDVGVYPLNFIDMFALSKVKSIHVTSKLNKEGVDETDIVGKDSEEVKELVRGEAGTIVKLSGYRNNENFVADVKRGSVETAVNGEIREENGKKFGYITITTFGSSTGDEVKAYLDQFVDAKLNNIVFDLRGNGGGYLVAANDVLNLFIDEGKTMYQMKEKKGAAKKAEATDGPKYNFPNSYILVDGQTASASEVVAGALQEQCNFKLVGSQTYGKGTAQTQKQLSDGSVLKYTYARWLLPSDTWIDGKGLTPDYSVSNIDISEITSESLESDMGYDSVGTAIASMQKMLNCLGYTCDRSDGYFSSQTVTALQQFEQANNLTVDGIYSDADRQILEATVLIYANDDANDYQYQKLMELVK